MTSSSENDSRRRGPLPWSRRFPPRTVLAALGALALCDAAFLLLAVRPAALEERERLARNSRLAAQVEQTRRRVESIQAAADRIAAAETEGKSLVQGIALPRRSAFSALLTELADASEEAGIEVRETSYSVEPIEGSEDYGILAVNANFRGGYDSLVQFLYRLDRSELFFIIGSLGATPRDEGVSRELQINMRFDTLVRGM